MSDEIVMTPIGRVIGGRTEPIDDDWDAVTCDVVLDDRFPDEALAGLAEFSHVDVVFVFDQVDEADITYGARHPRSNPDWPKVGIFAQRAKMRPNRIGVTMCPLLGIDGHVLHVRGLDAIDGTPVLDLKPYMREFGPRGATTQPKWATELMATYWVR